MAIPVKLLEVRTRASGHTVTVWRDRSGRRRQHVLAPGEHNEASLAIIRRRLESQPPRRTKR